jgi:hypothetical protein
MKSSHWRFFDFSKNESVNKSIRINLCLSFEQLIWSVPFAQMIFEMGITAISKTIQ